MRHTLLGITLAAALAVGDSSALAAKPGGAGGGSSAAYTIIDLPGPNHDADGGVSRTFAERVSDVGPGGRVFVLGRYDTDSSYQPCVWTVDADGASVTDLAGLIDRPADINSAGVIAGATDDRPALLFLDGTTIFLADASSIGDVRALNNPDPEGVFRVVGYVGSGAGVTPVVWDVTFTGTVLGMTPLIDSGGRNFYATDINDLNDLAGFVYIDDVKVPAMGAFDEGGQLHAALRPNPNPDEIAGFWDFQIDAAGNLLGDGYQLVEFGFYARAAIWPADGGVIDLSAETGITTTTGPGIALVDGVMQVVGRAEKDGRGAIAYLYTNGKLNNLGPMSKGDQSWTFDRAEGINTAGMICGVGKVGGRKNQQLHGFLLLPNPQ